MASSQLPSPPSPPPGGAAGKHNSHEHLLLRETPTLPPASSLLTVNLALLSKILKYSRINSTQSLASGEGEVRKAWLIPQ